jgi:outer membrane protein assembly factor BamB
VDDAPLCPAFGGPAVSGDIAYLPCDNPRAVRVDSSGQIHQLWQAPVSAQGSPVLGGGAVWVVDWGSGVLYALDPAHGTVRQKISVGGAPHFASPTLARGKAYVGTLSGVVAVAGA